MRAAFVCFALVFPLLASSQSRKQHIQSSTVSVSVISAESIEPRGVQHAEVFLRGVSAGTTNSDGAALIRGITVVPRAPITSLPPGVLEGLSVLPGPIRGANLYAAYAPANDTDRGTVVLLDSPDELAFMLGDRPHALLDGPVDWSCPGVSFTYDASANTLEAEPFGCSDPAILELSCPVSLLLPDDEAEVFTATTNADLEVPLRWTVHDSENDNVIAEYTSGGPTRDSESRLIHAFSLEDAYGYADLEQEAMGFFTIRADLGGQVSEACRVRVDYETPNLSGMVNETSYSARFAIGRNFEFKTIQFEVGLQAPIPVDMPLAGDLSVLSFEDYLGVNLDALCLTPLSEQVELAWGGGLHLLRYSGGGDGDIEIGPGVTGRLTYDGGWPVDPIAEVKASYLYGTVVPALSVGAAYRFNR